MPAFSKHPGALILKSLAKEHRKGKSEMKTGLTEVASITSRFGLTLMKIARYFNQENQDYQEDQDYHEFKKS